MKKNVLLVTTIICLTLSALSCKGKDGSKASASEPSKIEKSFAQKIYINEDSENELYFADDNFFTAGLGFGIYSFDKKSSQMTIKSPALISSEDEILTYDSKNDSFTDSDGKVYIFERMFNQQEIDDINELKEVCLEIMAEASEDSANPEF